MIVDPYYEKIFYLITHFTYFYFGHMYSIHYQRPETNVTHIVVSGKDKLVYSFRLFHRIRRVEIISNKIGGESNSIENVIIFRNFIRQAVCISSTFNTMQYLCFVVYAFHSFHTTHDVRPLKPLLVYWLTVHSRISWSPIIWKWAYG